MYLNLISRQRCKPVIKFILLSTIQASTGLSQSVSNPDIKRGNKMEDLFVYDKSYLCKVCNRLDCSLRVLQETATAVAAEDDDFS